MQTSYSTAHYYGHFWSRSSPAMASGLAGKVRRSTESDEFDLSGYDQVGIWGDLFGKKF